MSRGEPFLLVNKDAIFKNERLSLSWPTLLYNLNPCEQNKYI